MVRATATVAAVLLLAFYCSAQPENETYELGRKWPFRRNEPSPTCYARARRQAADCTSYPVLYMRLVQDWYSELQFLAAKSCRLNFRSRTRS